MASRTRRSTAFYCIGLVSRIGTCSLYLLACSTRNSAALSAANLLLVDVRSAKYARSWSICTRCSPKTVDRKIVNCKFLWVSLFCFCCCKSLWVSLFQKSLGVPFLPPAFGCPFSGQNVCAGSHRQLVSNTDARLAGSRRIVSHLLPRLPIRMAVSR